MLLDRMTAEGFERVVFCTEPSSGLKAIIAIHSTALGPAGGGIRMLPYGSDEEALDDVLRLAQGMTQKSAAADLTLGGGKAVVIADPRDPRRSELLRAMGRAVEALGGQYLAGVDVGTSLTDMELLLEETEHVLTKPAALGGGGDVSRGTALGVVHAMRAVAAFRGIDSLTGLRVAVQGLGSVGGKVARMLVEAGAEVLVTDIREDGPELAAVMGATWIEPGDILDADVDVFCPCARGADIDDDSIGRLRASMVVGAANNILRERRHGAMLDERGIAYAPDYVANAGGIICDAVARSGPFDWTRAESEVARIHDRVLACLTRARDEGATAQDVADSMARERIAAHATAPAAALA